MSGEMAMQLSPQLLARDWVVYWTDLSSFVTCDEPVVILNGPDSFDNGATVESLGTLTGNQLDHLLLPLFAGEVVIIEGSSVEGGNTDIFAGGPNGFIGDLTNPITFGNVLVNSDGTFAFNNFSFYEEEADGLFTNIGSATLSSTVPEPNIWAMLLLGTGSIGWMLRRRRGWLSA